jgi:hypothetical protein
MHHYEMHHKNGNGTIAPLSRSWSASAAERGRPKMPQAKGPIMTKLALYVPLQAKPGKESELVNFLKSALPLVNDEPGTVTW